MHEDIGTQHICITLGGIYVPQILQEGNYINRMMEQESIIKKEHILFYTHY